MTDVQTEIEVEIETKNKWDQLLRGTTQAVVEPDPVVEEISESEEEISVEITEDSPEAVLAQLYKSMIKT
jgi:hypothetical protein